MCRSWDSSSYSPSPTRYSRERERHGPIGVFRGSSWVPVARRPAGSRALPRASRAPSASLCVSNVSSPALDGCPPCCQERWLLTVPNSHILSLATAGGEHLFLSASACLQGPDDWRLVQPRSHDFHGRIAVSERTGPSDWPDTGSTPWPGHQAVARVQEVRPRGTAGVSKEKKEMCGSSCVSFAPSSHGGLCFFHPLLFAASAFASLSL